MEQVLKIGAVQDGCKRLEALITNLAKLKELQYTTEQIVQMVASKKFNSNLEQALKAKPAECKELPFTREQMASDVSSYSKLASSSTSESILSNSHLLLV